MRLSHYIEVHRGQAEVSFAEHVEQRRRDKVAHASSFKLTCPLRPATPGQQRTPVSFTEQRQVIEIVREAQTEIQA